MGSSLPSLTVFPEREFPAEKFQSCDGPNSGADPQDAAKKSRPLQRGSDEPPTNKIIREISYRINHEKNVGTFAGSTLRLAKELYRDSAFAAYKARLGILSYFLLRKSYVQNQALLLGLERRESVLAIPENLFFHFLNSEKFDENVDFFRARQNQLQRSLAKVADLNFESVEDGNLSLYFDARVFATEIADQNIENQLRFFRGGLEMEIEKVKWSTGSWGKFLRLVFQAVLCLRSEVKFRFFDPQKKAKFNWDQFFESNKVITKVQMIEEIDRLL